MQPRSQALRVRRLQYLCEFRAASDKCTGPRNEARKYVCAMSQGNLYMYNHSVKHTGSEEIKKRAQLIHKQSVLHGRRQK